MQYSIYHPLNGALNTFLDMSVQYELVASVEAEDVLEAFTQAQNDFNDDYSKLHIRSTSVGDIIMSEQAHAYLLTSTEIQVLTTEQLGVMIPYLTKTAEKLTLPEIISLLTIIKQFDDEEENRFHYIRHYLETGEWLCDKEEMLNYITHSYEESLDSISDIYHDCDTYMVEEKARANFKKLEGYITRLYDFGYHKDIVS